MIPDTKFDISIYVTKCHCVHAYFQLPRPSSAASTSESDGEEGKATSEVARQPKKAKRGATKVDEALMRYLSRPSASEVISKKVTV